jgi:hypothetical protein
MPGNNGQLIPWINPVTGIPGWQITTTSRHLAVAVASVIPGTTINAPQKGEWQARIPQSAVNATVTAASAGSLSCRIGSTGILDMGYAPWPASTVLQYAPQTLPAPGRLLVKEINITTRMGRSVRYLIPVFTTA